MGKCNYKFLFGVRCQRETWAGSEKFCIFHDPQKSTPEAKAEFEWAIKEQFASGNFDCRGYVFPALYEDEFAAGEVVERLVFRELLPEGAGEGDGPDVPDGADFADACFPDHTSFEWLRFGKGADFSYAHFGAYASFEDAVFGGGADFKEAYFGAYASFMNAVFGAGADFSFAGFVEGANFACVRFCTGANFDLARFGARVNFVDAEFGAGADFSRARFGEGAAFLSVRFGAGARFGRVKFGEGTDFSEADFRGAYLYGSVFGRAVVDAETKFVDEKGRLGDELRIKEGQFAPGESKQEAYAKAEDAYRRVRQLLKGQGFYHDAGEFYYRERCCRRKSHGWWPGWLLSLCRFLVARVRHVHDSKAFARLQAQVGEALAWRRRFSFSQRLLEWLMWLSCGYGERPGWLLAWAALFVLGFAGLYCSFPAFFGIGAATPGGIQPISGYWEALYFSLATFTTLGFGDFAPRGAVAGKLIVGFEAVLGALIIGLAMVTFARKAIRD